MAPLELLQFTVSKPTWEHFNLHIIDTMEYNGSFRAIKFYHDNTAAIYHLLEKMC